jgi:hypothetical protein
MALQVSNVAWTVVCLGVSQTTHDLYGLTVCKKNLNQIDCKIIIIEGEGKVLSSGERESLSMFWNSIEIRWICLQHAKV